MLPGYTCNIIEYTLFTILFNILFRLYFLGYTFKAILLSLWERLCLKEHYRIGKKQKSWRSQIYIKLTRTKDDDSWKHPLKYFCLKCHIRWEINNLTSHLEVIAQWVFCSFLFWHQCNAKFLIGFSLGVSQHTDALKPVKIWAQMVIEREKFKKKTPKLYYLVCFQRDNKRL